MLENRRSYSLDTRKIRVRHNTITYCEHGILFSTLKWHTLYFDGNTAQIRSSSKWAKDFAIVNQIFYKADAGFACQMHIQVEC